VTGRILQQFRDVLDRSLLQELAASALCEKRLYFAAQFGICLGQQSHALVGSAFASRVV
jgi:hypothetical protein